MSAVDPEALDLAHLDESNDDAEGSGPRPSGPPSPSHEVLVPFGGAFEGQVAITGPTRIDGSVRGSLRGTGDLVLGAGGRIEGRVECESLESEGEIVGPVSVRTRVRLAAGARVDGDLQAPIVSLDEEAILNGRVQIGSAPIDDPIECADPVA